MNIDVDDYTLLGLRKSFALDRSQLDAAWKSLQARVHPDRFAAEGGAAQRLAMQWAVRVNEAHQRLKDPLKRAAYLCELAGVSVQSESNTAMPGAFLMQQMQWREALEEADTAAEVETLSDEVQLDRKARIARLTSLLDVDANPTQAAQEVRALMFIDRLLEEIDARLERYEDAH
ncbi:MAG: Fe-S protein assembly co-chaperone HscB [Aquabacterium sp.]|uniref:Fe-S protein assembly co-chaperone HscB n=1 Tax=Aquabacterium sp. TaxID=1872578 RepID=UPI001B454039|nr:Fe-S protein assembly co-chaperone HscB [Aquabacterium sp.]MBP7133130.1 Fe-S protein assembly co-chaperone HscB [Aquabacterium sp.]MBP9062998.1 Fe-S protein assembly co-chaperone HscB [Aquabacterium sp.]